MRPQIDILYIYRQTGKATSGIFEKINKRHVEGQTMKFMRGNMIDQSDKVFRYAQTVLIRPKDKSLQPQYRTFLIITLDHRKTTVSKFFREAKKRIENDRQLTQMAFLTDSEPVSMNIIHEY